MGVAGVRPVEWGGRGTAGGKSAPGHGRWVALWREKSAAGAPAAARGHTARAVTRRGPRADPAPTNQAPITQAPIPSHPGRPDHPDHPDHPGPDHACADHPDHPGADHPGPEHPALITQASSTPRRATLWQTIRWRTTRCGGPGSRWPRCRAKDVKRPGGERPGGEPPGAERPGRERPAATGAGVRADVHAARSFVLLVPRGPGRWCSDRLGRPPVVPWTRPGPARPRPAAASLLSPPPEGPVPQRRGTRLPGAAAQPVRTPLSGRSRSDRSSTRR